MLNFTEHRTQRLNEVSDTFPHGIIDIKNILNAIGVFVTFYSQADNANCMSPYFLRLHIKLRIIF